MTVPLDLKKKEEAITKEWASYQPPTFALFLIFLKLYFTLSNLWSIDMRTNTHTNEIHYKCLLDENMRHILLMTPIKAPASISWTRRRNAPVPSIVPTPWPPSGIMGQCHVSRGGGLGSRQHHNLPRSDPITAQAASANHVSGPV